MKRITLLSIIFICFVVTPVKAVTTIIENYTRVSGSIHACGEDYQNSTIYIWNINTEVNHKPVLIECNMDTDYSDILYIYAVDNNGNEHLVKSLSGVYYNEYISTNLPTGRAKVVFITNDYFCGDPAEGEYYWGIENFYEVDNSYPTHEKLSVNSLLYVNGNSLVNGNLGVGTLNPQKKMEIWDGNSAGFTFSGSAATTAYEVAQTLDNTGYKLNVDNSTRDYRIAIGGVDLLKLLKNNNIALGAYSLYNPVTSASYNIAIGYSAGRYITNGTTNNGNVKNSIFLGADTKAQANGQTNQIVIGHNAIGNGSNTVTLGGNEITKTILKGNVGIGTSNPDEALTVNGKIHAKEIILDTNIPLPDYVFAPDYKRKSLLEMEDYIKANSHLPNMPSATEVQEKGLNTGEIINKLLQTVEEQMLYIIELEKRITGLENK